MEKLNLPTYSFKTKFIDGKNYIFDNFRRKYIILTPEEWVRQHFLNFLVVEKHYPKSLISVEKNLIINQNSFRADIVAYNKNAEPILLVECKAASVKIEQTVFEQIGTYNILLKVPYLIVTNGISHFCCKINFLDSSYVFLKEIPDYTEL
ncbi:MAG TPA: restriction endonuclease subunit R [Bacteroidales bacterium]|nr:MAG: restriction endonuclease subunit R [Bacteroidetes bacterium GWF2_33_38]OFY75951.1 MAG: restriction endonuclease subunit R [Bacteroidetes bacterium RIFOXYA12_FULL_33_9]OFY86261.1 MAG: restriction endonuclease subunit R [Bacteroidetes bacterium RIFOXYA2_FULL_33_7]HBF88212.1 restriction endonuclease subunit R [Bacteroidales bacterium]